MQLPIHLRVIRGSFIDFSELSPNISIFSMLPSDELRDSFPLADSPWELGRRIIRSPEANKVNSADEGVEVVEASMTTKMNEVNEENEATAQPASPGWLIVEVPHLIDETSEYFPEVNFEKGLSQNRA